MTDSAPVQITDADLKKAEHNGYARGYYAGRQKRKAEQVAARHLREQQAFLDKALLAALPACIQAQGWKTGDEPITNVPQRVALAVKFANEAMKQRRIL